MRAARRVLFSTYIGGSGIDEARGMTIDALGNVYVVGSTTSTNFPTVSPRQAALAGESDGFLLRISTTGGGLSYSTYFGGDGRRRGERRRRRRRPQHVHRGYDAIGGLPAA